MRSSAYGIPISVNAATKGEPESFSEFHGRMTARRKTDPTKNRQIRVMTELAALATARSGSSDSAAAMVATSAPTIEKMTVTTPAVSAVAPFGRKPPWLHRLLKSRSLSGHTPNTKRLPHTMKKMMAATLMPANQYSNLPNEATEKRLVAVMSTMSTRAEVQIGTSTQYWMIFAPATASKPTTMTQKYQ